MLKKIHERESTAPDNAGHRGYIYGIEIEPTVVVTCTTHRNLMNAVQLDRMPTRAHGRPPLCADTTSSRVSTTAHVFACMHLQAERHAPMFSCSPMLISIGHDHHYACSFLQFCLPRPGAPAGMHAQGDGRTYTTYLCFPCEFDLYNRSRTRSQALPPALVFTAHHSGMDADTFTTIIHKWWLLHRKYMEQYIPSFWPGGSELPRDARPDLIITDDDLALRTAFARVLNGDSK